MPTTTPPWAPDDVTGRSLLHVPRRWPITTAYVTGVIIVFGLLCWAGRAW